MPRSLLRTYFFTLIILILILIKLIIVVIIKRFREVYYWDSYWTIKGLLLCDMFHTSRSLAFSIISNIMMMMMMTVTVTYGCISKLVKENALDDRRGMIENFKHLVEKIGHIPNGNRVYYNRRFVLPNFHFHPIFFPSSFQVSAPTISTHGSGLHKKSIKTIPSLQKITKTFV